MADLTPAENRVLPLLLEGLRNKEIADKLNSSIHTVKHHVSSILAKARCSDRLLLVAKAGQPVEGTAAKKVVAPLLEGGVPSAVDNAVEGNQHSLGQTDCGMPNEALNVVTRL